MEERRWEEEEAAQGRAGMGLGYQGAEGGAGGSKHPTGGEDQRRGAGLKGDGTGRRCVCVCVCVCVCEYAVVCARIDLKAELREAPKRREVSEAAVPEAVDPSENEGFEGGGGSEGRDALGGDVVAEGEVEAAEGPVPCEGHDALVAHLERAAGGKAARVTWGRGGTAAPRDGQPSSTTLRLLRHYLIDPHHHIFLLPPPLPSPPPSTPPPPPTRTSTSSFTTSSQSTSSYAPSSATASSYSTFLETPSYHQNHSI